MDEIEKGKGRGGKKKEEAEPIVKIEHKSIYEALAAFQGELPVLEKTATVKIEKKSGGMYEFKYTPLSEIMKAALPLLSKHGLSVRHELSEKGIECILTHETAEAKDSEVKEVRRFDVNSEKPDRHMNPSEIATDYAIRITNELRSGIITLAKGGGEMKDIGGAITYARRYSLTMLLGISSEEDKDAEFEDARKEQAVNAMYERVQKGITNAKTEKELTASANVLDKNIMDIANGRTPSLGLDKEQLDELMLLVGKRKAELLKGKGTPGNNNDGGGEAAIQFGEEANPKVPPIGE